MNKHKKVKCCSNCARGTRISLTADILCKVHGAVTYDFVCTKHKSKLLPELEEGQQYKCIECEFFIPGLSEDNPSPNTGFCQLFTVRSFNGVTKNACSKFNKKVDRVI